MKRGVFSVVSHQKRVHGFMSFFFFGAGDLTGVAGRGGNSSSVVQNLGVSTAECIVLMLTCMSKLAFPSSLEEAA